MSKKVLVTYASRSGATKEMAEKIGEVILKDTGQVDIKPVEQVKNVDAYDAVVVGSAVYIGAWRKKALIFLKKNEEQLKTKSVWFFSSGPTGTGDPVELAKGWHHPKALEPFIESVQPKDVALFHGKVDETKMNFIEKWMIKKVGAPIGEFRDWQMIEKWAGEIAGALK